MKKCLPPILLIFVCQMAKAQLGLTAAPTSGFSPKWQILVENYVTEHRTNFLDYGVTGLVDFHLPLKIKALSLRPAVHGMRSSFHHFDYHFDVYALGFQANVNFEPGAKREDKPKGFTCYLQFSPGLDLVHHRFDRPVQEQGQPSGGQEKFVHAGLAANLGFNLLFEIKLTTLLSVSPQIGIRYYPAVTWEGFTEQVTEGQLTEDFDRTSWRHLTAGLRIGLDLENGLRR